MIAETADLRVIDLPGGIVQVVDKLTRTTATAQCDAASGWYVSRAYLDRHMKPTSPGTITPTRWWPSREDAVQGLARYLRRMEELV